MPKIINHRLHKETIARAACRVIEHHGAAALTVRAVAQEARLPVSTLRHYFPAQHELIIFTMQHVAATAAQRIHTVVDQYQGVERLKQVAYQFLPLDAERQVEIEAWLALAIQQGTEGRTLKKQVEEQIFTLFYHLLSEERDIVIHHLEVHHKARHLHALLDGLALLCITDTEGQALRMAVVIVDQYIDSLYGISV